MRSDPDLRGVRHVGVSPTRRVAWYVSRHVDIAGRDRFARRPGGGDARSGAARRGRDMPEDARPTPNWSNAQ